MSDKKRTSVTLDSDVHNYLQRQEVNTSGKINKLIRKEMESGGGERVMLELRIDQVEDDIEILQSQLKNKRRILDNLESRLNELGDKESKERKEMLRKVHRVPDDPENGYVQEVAEELDMTPEEVLEESKKL